MSQTIEIGFQSRCLKLELSKDQYSATIIQNYVESELEFLIRSIPHHLSQPLYIIDSAKSGTGRSPKTEIWSNLLKPALDFLGVAYRYVRTASKTSISDLAHSLKESSTTLVFISGDTSITEFVNALPETMGPSKITIFPIPAGTGNSLALSLGHLDVASSLRILLTSHKEPIPLNLYLAEFPGESSIVSGNEIKSIGRHMVFLVVLSWAFHASLVADSDTPEMREKGLERFKLAAQSNLSREQRYVGQTTVGDDQVEGPYAYWLVTLAQRFEPTFEILPCGSIKDDNLYLVAFKSEESVDGQYIMDIMNQVYDKGSHLTNPKVTYLQIPKGQLVSLQVEPSLSHRFCVDGTIVQVRACEADSTIKVSSIGNSFRSWQFYVIT